MKDAQSESICNGGAARWCGIENKGQVMSDMADDFREMREVASEKKRKNLKKSTDILLENGIRFESKNNGVHLIIQTPGGVINFWPSTGLFSGAMNGRGVFNLIKKLEAAKVDGN